MGERGSSHQNFVERALIHHALLGNQARRLVAFLLNFVPGVAACPGPLHLMRSSRAVEPLPVIKIGFAFEQLVHRFDDVLRIRNERDAARLFERFEAEASGDNFGLLIGQIAEVLAEDFAQALVFEHGHGGGARFAQAIAEAAPIANYGDLFHGVF